MRIKTLLAVAALTAAGLATSMAQNVYSLNVVGYYNVTVPANSYAALGNQLVQTNDTIGNLLANVPGGTVVLKWNGAGFDTASFDADFQQWDNPNMTLGPGEGFFIQNTTANDFTVTFVGEVNQNSNSTQFKAGQYSFVSLWTPQAGPIGDGTQADPGFDFNPAGNDQVLQWNGTGYDSHNFDPDFLQWDTEPNLKVGEGFFVLAGADRTWTRIFTVK